MTGLLRRPGEDGPVEKAQLRFERMLDGKRCSHCLLDAPAAIDQLRRGLRDQRQPERSGVDDGIERAAIGHVETYLAELRHMHRLFVQIDERGYVAERC